MTVFPARAGMSPMAQAEIRGLMGVPRASGDEPWVVDKLKGKDECSPRERG